MKSIMLVCSAAAVWALGTGCGTSLAPTSDPIVVQKDGVRLVVGVRVFDADGNEVPCTTDLTLVDSGRQDGGAHELELTACHETLDADARTYGAYRFEYLVPDGSPRYLQARSRGGARLVPPEFTVQVGEGDGATAWRSLSVAYAGR
jgi:hypothetical protein